MGFLQAIIYGFVSGFTELIPVSGPAHQQITKYLFGLDMHQPILDLLVHIATLAAVIAGSFNTITRLRRERNSRLNRRRGKKASGFYDLRILRTAAIPMVIAIILYGFLAKQSLRLPLIAIGSLLFGAVLLIVDHMRHGNKTSQNISPLDSLAMGFGCALAVIPGISRVGMAMSVSIARGADKNHAYTWALLLTIPALIVLCILNLISIFTTGIGAISFVLFLLYLVAAIFAFLGGYCAISIFHNLSQRIGLSGYAYYSIGLAIFSFILYLIT